jgi:hypothetical protein
MEKEKHEPCQWISAVDCKSRFLIEPEGFKKIQTTVFATIESLRVRIKSKNGQCITAERANPLAASLVNYIVKVKSLKPKC